MRTDSCSPIPRLIHQTWKTRDVPPEFQALQRGWIDRNPGFEYRFWTDEDIGRFIAEEHPALLPVFHGYADPIARIDLARYLILRRFGGVYADLDFECLRPIDGVLEGRSFVVGLEPAEHGRLAKAVERGLPRILCPSFLASVPGHPFWDHLLDRLVEARTFADVLDATGPFLLTRAHADYEWARHEDGAAAVTVLPPELLYPVTKEDCWSGRLFDPVFWERATRRAYAVHYWEGTWFRDAAGRGAGPEAALPRQVAAVVPDGRPEDARSPIKAEGLPLISCLMVTRGRRALLEFAIDGFARQTYPNRELVIVCDSPALPQDDPLERAIRAAHCPNIRLIRVNAAGREGGATLGELRNIAVDHAAGRYVCQWDDDDLYDPCRLQMQQRVLAAAGAQACLLGRWMIWWPAEDRLAVSCERDWEGSLLCEKAVMPRYPALRRGEDTPVVEQLRRSARVVRMDLPRLYTYVVHGANTFGAAHFEVHWQIATARFEGDRCRAMLEEMGKRLPVEAYRRAVRGNAGEIGAAPAGADIEVEVAGHLGAATGLGSAVRGTVAALRASGLPVSVIDMPLAETHPVAMPAAPPAGAESAAAGAFAVTLIHTNPDALRQSLNARPGPQGPDPRLDPGRLSGRFTIGYWAWEASSGIPDPWRDCLPLVDEIWVPSSFTAAAVAPHVPVPVIAMPHAVAAPQVPPAFDRRAFGIPDGTVCFLTLFDATSNVTRKNPAGLIRAYRTAFPDATSDTLLIVKAKKLTDGECRALEASAGGRPDIRIVNEPWTAERTAALMAACDAYVSLHRAEGFGLTVAEAMACGKPVIATAYSGTMDITTPDTAWLVPCRTVTLEADDGYYRRGTVWAEPDLEAAARLMRRVVSHPDEARAVGARAADRMRTRFSPQAVGARMRDRLSVLMASRLRPPVRPPLSPAVPTLEAGRGRGGVGRGTERVLVLTPVKDAVAHLPRYLDLLGRLDHDPSRLSLGFLEGDSRDGTHDWLAARLPELRDRYRRVTLLRHDYGFRPEGSRWAPDIQRRRRELLARSRNRLLSGALGDEDWVLWLDADLVAYPPDLLARLLAAGRDIVVPHCVLPDGRTFDLNSFRLTDPEMDGEDPRHLADGIFQPPRGVGRLYLDAFAGEGIVPLDGVGGTALLVRADLHREGLCFPPYSHRGYIETEGLAMMAKDMGVAAWGLPDLRIIHAAQ